MDVPTVNAQVEAVLAAHADRDAEHRDIAEQAARAKDPAMVAEALYAPESAQ